MGEGKAHAAVNLHPMKPLLIRLLLPCLFCLPWFAHAAAAEKPNIIYIITDDLGYGDIGCYGARKVKTPNLDRLASQGCRFTDAHSTASVCTPTRYALLTGRYAWRQPGTGIAPGDAPALLKPGTATVPSMLKAAGYKTGVVGKWHLGLGDGPKTDFNGDIKPGPLEIGFDYAFYIPATGDRVPCVLVENHRVVGYDPADPIRVSYGAKIGDEPTGDDPNVKLKIKGGPGHTNTVINGIPRIGFMTGGKAARWVDEDIADTLTAKAVKFIESNKAGPFFLYLATHDIHEPMVPHPRFRGTSECGWRGDVIHQLDWTVGEILAALDRLKLATNTLVVFTGDNGAALPHGKGSLYDPGSNVPFLVRWPGVVKPGGESRALLSGEDLAPTLLAAVGVPAPAKMSGVSFLPLLKGQPYTPRQHIFVERGPHGSAPVTVNMSNSGYDLSRAVRSDRYKFIYNCTPWIPYAPVDSSGGAAWTEMKAAHADSKLAPGVSATYFTTPRPVYELYDLDADPSELNNLSGKPQLAATERALRLALAEKMILDFDYLPLPAMLEGAAGAGGPKRAAAANENARAANFAKLDHDNDGRLSKAEFSAGRKAEEAEKWFGLRDTNGDGFISREEFLPGSPLPRKP